MSNKIYEILRWIAIYGGEKLVSVGEFFEDRKVYFLSDPFFWMADRLLAVIDWLEADGHDEP